jgi:rubrerythrin
MTDQTAASTLENLQAAFNGESNARARYLAFAKKADEEGYAQAARLFRAASRAEEIHAANHAAVIRRMDATASAAIQPVNVQSTRENLREAIKGEVYERDVMYPNFLAQARAENNAAAVRTFSLALAVEAEHAALYTLALENLESWRKAAGPYYVCPVCGSTLEALRDCAICRAPKERFETIL